jgi:hypothetical protein
VRSPLSGTCARRWTPEYLAAQCGDLAFECGPVEMRLPTFLRYAERCREEKPLYLFDKRFFDKAHAHSSKCAGPLYYERARSIMRAALPAP